MLERLITNEEVDVAGRAGVPMGTDCQPSHNPVANAQPGKLGSSRPHRVEHAARDDALEETQIGFRSGTIHSVPHR